jgi:hypothetical protein
LLQKVIPFKKVLRKRKDNETVNIDGLNRNWGDFTKKFLEDNERKKRQG